jgi:hypothetical protein
MTAMKTIVVAFSLLLATVTAGVAIATAIASQSGRSEAHLSPTVQSQAA